jgi:glycine/sarcosine N-methyltransferase
MGLEELPMYDALSADYDYFVNWPERLAAEMPFIEAQLRPLETPGRPLRVLDAACGTGMHVIELARRGYTADGADLSRGMVERARQNAETAGVTAAFEPLGLGSLAAQFSGYDAVLCLGNSLPHLLHPNDLERALLDCAACLRPGGLLLIQNRNFDHVWTRQERWMNPESYRSGDQEWLFIRFYDFDPDSRITFNILTLTRQGEGPWKQRATDTRLWPQRQDELVRALQQAGFGDIQAYGGMNGSPFSPESSGNLILVACKD